MPPQTVGTFSQLANTTEYRKVFNLLDGYLQEEKPIWKGYYNIEKSNRRTEVTQTYGELIDVPEKGEGAPYATDTLRPAFQKSVTSLEFGLGFEITETALEDDRFGILKKSTKWLAHSARYVEEVRAAGPLNNGFSGEQSSDGVSAFSASHVLASGDTRRNILSPAADLSWTSLTQAMIDSQNETRSDGNRFVTPITRWRLLVPPALKYTAARIIRSTLLPGSADHDKNVLGDFETFDITVNPQLTDTDAWILLAADKSKHGLTSYTRIPITLAPVMMDARTGNDIYKIRFRRSWFWNQWQGSFATAGA